METKFHDLFHNVMWGDFDEKSCFPSRKPLLAHYTSLNTFESICKSNEIWFSNPLCMNDYEELRFVLLSGRDAFLTSQALREACRTQARYDLICEKFNILFSQLENEYVFDTYAFCLSLHSNDDADGILSMWRGYGSNGAGVAIVFDTEQIETVEKSPFLIAPVIYLSKEGRLAWIQKKLDELSKVIKENDVSDDYLWTAAFQFLYRLKMFALYTKHEGFREENEWRIIYDVQRDLLPDGMKRSENMLHYSITQQGVFPKLKLKLVPTEDTTGPNFRIENIIQKIILGPSHNRQLMINSVQRMLGILKKNKLAKSVVASEIPYQANN